MLQICSAPPKLVPSIEVLIEINLRPCGYLYIFLLINNLYYPESSLLCPCSQTSAHQRVKSFLMHLSCWCFNLTWREPGNAGEQGKLRKTNEMELQIQFLYRNPKAGNHVTMQSSHCCRSMLWNMEMNLLWSRSVETAVNSTVVRST